MPVLLLTGARQVGKSTLVKSLFKDTHTFYTLDNPQTRYLVAHDPINFIRSQKRPIIIDEIQRYPELLLTIKMVVDETAIRTPKQFILTGSFNLLNLKGCVDSLAGRLSRYTLWPLSQEEIFGSQSTLLQDLFDQKFILSGLKSSNDLMVNISKGGYPLVVNAQDTEEAKEWLDSYIATLIDKDIPSIAKIEGLIEIPNILRLLASRVGEQLNVNKISQQISFAAPTIKSYLNLLELAFLFYPLKAWGGNIGNRLYKTPKIFLNDTALVNHLLNRDLSADRTLFGHLLENFVGLELIKQLSYKLPDTKIYYYRRANKQEVDFVLENASGDIVVIEVKASSQFSTSDIKEMRELKERMQGKFKAGILLYQGDAYPIEDKIYAMPVTSLWQNN